jgi:hypothetical protein
MGTTSEWRKPFIELKTSLRALYDSNLTFYHCVVLSTNRSRTELSSIIEMLEPAYCGKSLVHEIPVATDGCTYHSHLFFSDDRRGITQLGRLLHDLDTWMDQIPGGFVPAFGNLPVRIQTDRNIIRWASLVYYLAAATDATYLDLEVEYLASIDRIGFFPWFECPQPPRCSPLEWLTHRSSTEGVIPKVKHRFQELKEPFPDVVDAYLLGEFIEKSIAAIDILAYVFDRERREKTTKSEALSDSSNESRKPRGRYKKTEREKKELESTLLRHHNPWENSDFESDVESPLTQKQLADEMGWITAEKELDITRVHHRMKAIFGDQPMKAYRKELLKAVRGSQDSHLSLMQYAIVEKQAEKQADVQEGGKVP